MKTLQRFDADGKWLGFVVVDRPMEMYEGRTDLTEEPVPPPGKDLWPHRVNGKWEMRAKKKDEPTKAPKPQ